MELGLSQADEVSHLYHMVSEGDWRLCVRAGPYDSEHSDARSSKAVTLTLRHGRAHASFAMDAVGYVALAQVYEALLQPDAAFNRERDNGQRRGWPRGASVASLLPKGAASLPSVSGQLVQILGTVEGSCDGRAIDGWRCFI